VAQRNRGAERLTPREEDILRHLAPG
jgi:hypothetical protein